MTTPRCELANDNPIYATATVATNQQVRRFHRRRITDDSPLARGRGLLQWIMITH